MEFTPTEGTGGNTPVSLAENPTLAPLQRRAFVVMDRGASNPRQSLGVVLSNLLELTAVDVALPGLAEPRVAA